MTEPNKEEAGELELAVITLREQLQGGHPDFFDMTIDEMLLHNAKNTDYTKGGDPLDNFTRVSELKKLWPKMDWSSPVGVCIGYAFKQLDAGMHMLEEGYEGEVENVDTRFRDVHVYFKLARILHKEYCELGENLTKEHINAAMTAMTYREK